jgi:hypothetical protein
MKYDKQLVTINHVRGHNFQNLTNCNITLSISNAFVISLFCVFLYPLKHWNCIFWSLFFFLFFSFIYCYLFRFETMNQFFRSSKTLILQSYFIDIVLWIDISANNILMLFEMFLGIIKPFKNIFSIWTITFQFLFL